MTHLIRNIFFGAAAAISAFSLTSCEDVAPENRYIEVEGVVPGRAVLLEDFTGQNCLNCPLAHETVDKLVEQYGADKVIAVSIHCGGFGMPVRITNFNSGLVGLMTDEGNAILEAYPIVEFPMGVIDGGSPVNFDQWATSVYNALKIYTGVNIDLSAEYDADSRDGAEGYFGTIRVKADVSSELAREGGIQFWIVEDGIKARQRQPDGSYIEDYTHNNVFRAMVFENINGTPVSINADGNVTVEGSIATRWTDKERWELENLSVVAFMTSSEGVLQAAKVPLFPKSESK